MDKPLTSNFEMQNLVVMDGGMLHPGQGWQAIDGMFRSGTMIGPLGTFLGHIMAHHESLCPQKLRTTSLNS